MYIHLAFEHHKLYLENQVNLLNKGKNTRELIYRIYSRKMFVSCYLEIFYKRKLQNKINTRLCFYDSDQMIKHRKAVI